jgi:chromosome partitioning protein
MDKDRSHKLAKQGKKVLVIDADAQGSLTASLGFTEPDKLDVTLANVLEKVARCFANA